MLTVTRTDATDDLGPLVARLEATPTLSTDAVADRLRSELVRCENRLAPHGQGARPLVRAELGKRGWLGMTWPTEGRRSAHGQSERFVVFEALIA
jgi:alkylation response protein AidB-like acyl-CoA dehydrogenase